MSPTYTWYIHTTNRQQNTQTQYPRHGEKPGINMTQATTTTVLKIQQMYGILHHQQTLIPQQHVIHHQSRYNRYRGTM